MAGQPQSQRVLDTLERTHARSLSREFVRNDGQFSESREAEARQPAAPAGATDFFADADLQAKARFSPHPHDQAAARRELAERRAKAQAVAEQQASRRPARKTNEWAAWYRSLNEDQRLDARVRLKGRDGALVAEVFDRVEQEEIEAEFGPLMTEEPQLQHDNEPAEGRELTRFFESPDPEHQAALEQWLDDDSGFIDEPDAEDNRSLGEVYDDEYADALAEYGDMA
jgi:hypothetical protein